MEINEVIQKLIWKSKEGRIAKTTMNKNNEMIFVLNNKSYYKAIIIKETGCWQRNWQTIKPGPDLHIDGNSAYGTGIIINLLENKGYSI